jgi:hypothetical protein
LKIEKWLPPWDNPWETRKPFSRKEPLMKVNTRKRRNARRVFEQLYGLAELGQAREELIDRMYQIISKGKQGLDAFVLEVGKMIAEAIMYIEREEVSGPEYRPMSSEIQKWASP